MKPARYTLGSLFIAGTLVLACSSSSSGGGVGAAAVALGSDADDGARELANVAAALVAGDATSLRVATTKELLPTSPTPFRPAACMSATVDASASKATYVLSNCTPPRSHATVSGTIVVSWQGAGPLALTFSGTDTIVAGARLTWTATGNVTGDGSARTMAWDSKIQGTSAAGHALVRTSHETYTWTTKQDCLTENGAADGTVDGAQVHGDSIGFAICAGGCPQPGSEQRITDVGSGQSYDFRWTPTTLSYQGPGGEQQVALTCIATM